MAHIRFRLDELLTEYDLQAQEVIWDARIRAATFSAIRNNKIIRPPLQALANLYKYFVALNPDFRWEDLMVFEAGDVQAPSVSSDKDN